MSRQPTARPFARRLARAAAAAAASAAAGAPVAARAATYTWTGTGGAGTGYDWTVGSNWAGGVAPAATATDATVAFDDSGQAATSTVNVPYAIGTLSFNASAKSYTLTGNPVTLGNPSQGVGFLDQLGAAAQTINAPITLATLQGWHLSAGGGRVTFGGGVNTAGYNVAVYAADTSSTGNVLAGNVSGTGSLTMFGSGDFVSGTEDAGVLTLTGTNTYTGGTTLGSLGVLALGSAGALGTTGPINFAFGVLRFSAANTTDYSARIAPYANPNEFNEIAPYFLDTNGQNVTFASLSAGTAATPAAGLAKIGAGTLTLSGTSAVAGYVSVDGGTLAIVESPSTTTAPVKSVVVDGTAFVPATLALSGTAAVNVAAAADAYGDVFDVQVGLAGFGTVNQSAGTVAVSGPAPNSRVEVAVDGGSNGQYLLSGGAVTAATAVDVGEGGTGTFNQSGGTVSTPRVVVGDQNGSSGAYALTAGTLTATTLQIAANAGAAGSFTLGGTGTLVVGAVTAGGGTAAFHFDGGTFQPSASLVLSGLTPLDVRAGGAVFNVPAGLSLAVGQPLTHDATAGAPATDGGLTLNAGLLTLSAANTYTGPTVVNGGYLTLNDPTGSATGTGTVTVNNSGVLGGAGSVAGSLTVNAGGVVTGTPTVGGAATVYGTVIPGVSGTGGRVTFAGGLTLAAGSAVDVTLGGPTAGTGYGQLAVAGGPAALGGSLVLTLAAGFHPAIGGQFVVVDHAGSAATTGSFVNAGFGGFVADGTGDV